MKIPNIKTNLPDASKLIRHEVEKSIQPFVTNEKLAKLVKSQTPSWVNYSILIFTFLVVIMTGILLYYTANMMPQRTNLNVNFAIPEIVNGSEAKEICSMGNCKYNIDIKDKKYLEFKDNENYLVHTILLNNIGLLTKDVSLLVICGGEIYAGYAFNLGRKNTELKISGHGFPPIINVESIDVSSPVFIHLFYNPFTSLDCSYTLSSADIIPVEGKTNFV
jgi:hypothetical protein